MGFVDKRIELLNNVAVPASSGIPVAAGNIIDLGNFSDDARGFPFQDMFLVVNVRSPLTSSGAPRLVLGLSTMQGPSVDSATDALGLIGSDSRLWQFGNLDPSGVYAYGLAPSSLTNQQLLVAQITFQPLLSVFRYLGFWMALSDGGISGDAFDGGGTLSAYFTSVPPTGRVIADATN